MHREALPSVVPGRMRRMTVETRAIRFLQGDDATWSTRRIGSLSRRPGSPAVLATNRMWTRSKLPAEVRPIGVALPEFHIVRRAGARDLEKCPSMSRPTTRPLAPSRVLNRWVMPRGPHPRSRHDQPSSRRCGSASPPCRAPSPHPADTAAQSHRGGVRSGVA